jgi:hypothetical protein
MPPGYFPMCLSFSGSLLIATTVPGTYYVAWRLSTELGIFSSDPLSGLGWLPVSQYERIWKVRRKLVSLAAVGYGGGHVAQSVGCYRRNCHGIPLQVQTGSGYRERSGTYVGDGDSGVG